MSVVTLASKKETPRPDPKFSVQLKPIVIFPQSACALELREAPGGHALIVHAGTEIQLAVIGAIGKQTAEDAKRAALMVLNYVTHKLSGASARPNYAHQGGVVHADNIPLSSEMIFQNIEAAFPDAGFDVRKSW